MSHHNAGHGVHEAAITPQETTVPPEAPHQLNRRTFVKAAATAAAAAVATTAVASPLYAQGSEGGPVTQYGPGAPPVR